jgi:formiminotetrahydrofolate cyclodeaminase
VRIPAAGPLAAIVTSETAAVVAAAARLSGDEAAAAQAESLRARARELATADAEAYAAAAAQLALRVGDDFRLGRALEDAADVLLEIVDAAADLAELAAAVADRCEPQLRPDVAASATIADAAARAAAQLVEINLAVTPEDERARRARVSIEASSVALERALAGA